MATQHLTETIEHLDFDEALPCESTNAFCEPNCASNSAAVWSVLTAKDCCDQGTGERITLLCDNCFQRRATNRVVCVSCFKEWTPGRLIMKSVTPL